ncbi:MAG: DEAD/DEAH box helicase [Myxococcales bacterium]|nr:DEAD/DEAH box helicase [Myxococcales bacterium]
MQSLFEAVRDACAGRTWSQGVELVRAGGVVGQEAAKDELVFRIRDRAMAISPTVTLYLDEDEWDCDCRLKTDPCRHVAAAVIGLKRARESGDALPSGDARTVRVGYRFTRTPEGLAFRRVLVHQGGRETPLRHSLIAASQSGRPDGRARAGGGPSLKIVSSQADTKIELALGVNRHGVLSRPLMAKIFTELAECLEITLDGEKVEVGSEPVELRVRVSDAKDGEGFVVRLTRDKSITEVFNNGVVLCGNTLRAFGESKLTRRELQVLTKGQRYGPDQVAHLVTEVIPSLSRRIAVKLRTSRLPQLEAAKLRVSFRTSGERGSEILSVLPTLVYGDPPIARVDGDRLVLLGGGVPRRSERSERSLASKLHAELGLVPGHQARFTGPEAVRFVDRMRAFGGELIGDAHRRFRPVAGLEPEFRALPGGGFDLRFLRIDAAADEDDDEVGGDVASWTGDRVGDGPGGLADGLASVELRDVADPKRVLEAWQNGEEMVPLLGGGWAPLPTAWLERYGEQILFLLAARGEDGEVAGWAAPQLARLCRALEHPPTPELASLEALLDDFSGIPEARLPGDLTATLRGYQRRGVDWLEFLRGVGLGAMLADDMGLGKTLQALCVVRPGERTLIVAPTSVLHNWAAELAKFRPALRACVYHGPKRALEPDADVVLTTYALLRLDIDALADARWDMVVLDEAQMIKNPESQVAQASYRLQAGFRATLTGTPVENRLEELWSQFHFLNPGLLGGRREFQDQFARPIAAGSSEAARELRERIRPFTLRRRKQEVARELPPRTDMVLRCTLSEREREVYDAIRAATRKDVVERLQAGGGVLAALEALLRLRQAACHRGLVPGQDGVESSSKLELLLETLDEVVAEDHRALVFSQWTGMLDKIEPALADANIEYLRLDGSTRDRAAVVERFQREDGPPVMLISLKAGGTGLNLTRADHVFLMDPWWNPAAEDQAADRAHRIGQDRPVLVHRVVAADTVEERILELQERKRALSDAALEGSGAATSITRDDLLALLQ